jgi:hypothetical protein
MARDAQVTFEEREFTPQKTRWECSDFQCMWQGSQNPGKRPKPKNFVTGLSKKPECSTKLTGKQAPVKIG